MDIHEYQAKEILANLGVPIPKGALAYSPEQAAYRTQEIGGDRWVVKAQVHSGGRGKSGGIKVCSSDEEMSEIAESLLGKRLVTPQTDEKGKLINRLYVEEGLDIERELYLGLVMDRQSERVMLIASSSGGMDIEEVSESDPDSVLRLRIDPAVGMQSFQAREIAFSLGLGEQVNEVVKILMACYRVVVEYDASMVEINPLVVTSDKRILALDAKVSFDENALFRRPHISELRDKSQEDRRESYAMDRGLAYIGLDGSVGCIVNGAGLAMASMDMIKLAGGSPANFLDIGGGASPQRVIKAFRAVLNDENVRVILVNIFAGINRCDWIAEGVLLAFETLEIKIPVVVRLSGTNVELGQKMLRESGTDLLTADSLYDAANLAVKTCNELQA
jgi:malate-CoA ligase subunit beta